MECCARSVVAGSRGADRAAGDDHEVVAQPLDDVELVGREQHSGACGRACLQHAGDDVDGERVEPREGLVEDQHLGVVHQRRGDLGALLVAERQRLDVVAEALAESELLEQRGGAGGGIRLREAVQPREIDDLLEHLHLRVETALLGHVPEAAAIGCRDLGTVEGDRSGILREHAQHDAHRGRLAGAVAADEAGEAARPDVERHVVERESSSVALGDSGQLQHQHLLRWRLLPPYEGQPPPASPVRRVARAGVRRAGDTQGNVYSGE